MSYPRRRDYRVRRAEGVPAIVPLERARAREGDAGERREAGGRNIGSGEDREDARGGLRLGRVKRPDLGMGARRSKDGGVRLAVEVDVVLEPRAPCEKESILLASDELPNAELPHLVCLPVYLPVGAPACHGRDAPTGSAPMFPWIACTMQGALTHGARWRLNERTTRRRSV